MAMVISLTNRVSMGLVFLLIFLTLTLLDKGNEGQIYLKREGLMAIHMQTPRRGPYSKEAVNNISSYEATNLQGKTEHPRRIHISSSRKSKANSLT